MDSLIYRAPRQWLTMALLAVVAAMTACSGSTTTSDPVTNPPPQSPAPVVDSDGDGVADTDDVCPGTPAGTAVTANGCPVIADMDADNDGIADGDDTCPNTPSDEPADAQGCSASQRDTDGDAVSDADDQCPGTLADADVDANGCSDAQLDDDNDGFSNAVDECPGSEPGAFVPQSGCPIDGLTPVAGTRTRYAFNNQCFAMRSGVSGLYVSKGGGTYTADQADIANAEPLFMKPSALGKYLFYDSDRALVLGTPVAVGSVPVAQATDDAEWTLTAVADDTAYPPTPLYDTEPTPEEVETYFEFTDPNVTSGAFKIFNGGVTGLSLSTDPTGRLALVPADSMPPEETFLLEPADNCEIYPEASSNVAGESPTGMAPSFSGTTADGRVLGMADAHVHISATTFLGRTQWGSPIHKFGVPHALDDCTDYHGPQGTQDTVGALFSGDMDGHDVSGWPTFPEWPARDFLTHEAIYWKWLERGWQSGLRIAVNDVVDNATLCELQQASAPPDEAGMVDCNEMNNAGNQVGSMMVMQDYIDAQYGGRGDGFFQIVHDPERARSVVEAGQLAVVLGIEISNLLNCQISYNNPARLQQPFEETGNPADGGVTYGCTEETIVIQMQRLWDLGIRQIISIHEFDNAFGGNGIFDGMVLNLGNRENSGGTPASDPNDPFRNNPRAETPAGEFWTTYDCPEEGGVDNDGSPFSGYLWGSAGGSSQSFLTAPGECFFTGQGTGPTSARRPGGAFPCYPDRRQCNARWMTPIGLFFYAQMMEFGFIFDFDHMEYEMKTQALELAEAQDPPYPFVSTHGTFGGTSNDQAARVLRNGGFLYPSNGSSGGFRRDMDETLGVYNTAMSDVPESDQFLFGFGFGTDTNGLSAQTGARNNPENPIQYPYMLFSGPGFDELPEFDGIPGLAFNQPETRDPDGNGRTWHQDIDGNAQYGMLSGFVEEIRLDGTPEQLRHLYNSAEVFLQTWERTNASKDAIEARGGVIDPGGILRPAPVSEP